MNAVDFLHKPYFYERFNRAMQKAEQWLRMHDLLQVSESATRRMILKSEYKNVTVSVDAILYIESIDNYVMVHLATSRCILPTVRPYFRRYPCVPSKSSCRKESLSASTARISYRVSASPVSRVRK